MVAVGLVWLVLPSFNGLTGKTIASAVLVDPPMLLGLIVVAVVVGLLAGSYPALFLSAFRPAAVLKGEMRAGAGSGTLLRKVLIVAQFSFSIGLIISTGIVYNQMDYIRNKKLGFDKEHVVNIQLTDPTPRDLYRTYRQAIEQQPDVVSVSASSSAPASVVNEQPMQPVGVAQDENWFLKSYATDYDFVETMEIELLTGRTHSRDFPTDTLLAGLQGPLLPDEMVVTSVVLNETAAQDFGWGDPAQALGQEIQFTGGGNLSFRVIGVVKDFHSQSVHERIAPTMIVFGNVQNYLYVFVRIRPGNIAQTLASLERTWNEIMPNYAFEYTFLDEDFDGLYKADALKGTLLGYFALLTIFIACLGLFGLASFTAEQRTKEIGVRKTLGASVASIVLLLSKEFTKLVVVAFVVAAPVAYFAMDQWWLQDFAYRIDISWPIFLMAGLSALLIAWLTVSYQSVKAALTNPVEALRYE